MSYAFINRPTASALATMAEKKIFPRASSSSASMASSLFRRMGSCFTESTLSASSLARREYRIRIRAMSTSVASSLDKKGTTPDPPIVRPSITWGIIPHSREASQKVLDYLESEGIDTTELQDVELPTTIEVMQERLDFLKKLGLSLEVINSYPLMVTCSIKKNLVPVLDYLERLGVRAKDLPAFVEKYPMVLHSSVVIDLMPVVDYLLGLDIQKKDIARVLGNFPDVLGFRLEGTISTSVAYLISIGVRMRSIGRMLTEYPQILGMRVANTIKPKVDFLISYGVPKAVVAKLLEVRPYILGFDFEETMQPVVRDLLEAGVKKEGISAIITQYPDILGQSIEENIKRKTWWLMNEVKVDPSNVPRIIQKLPQVLFIKEGLAMERVNFFLSAGCSADDVAKMVTDCPQILALSITQVIEPNLNFLLCDMKRSLEEVVKFPPYFTYDLKSRIMPRHKLIAERGVECSLEWFLNCSDQKFKERLTADYIDDEETGPDFQMGGCVFTETKEAEETSSHVEDPGNVKQRAEKKQPPWQSYARARQLQDFVTDSESELEDHLQGRRQAVNKLSMAESLSELDDDDEDEDVDEDDDDDEIELSFRSMEEKKQTGLLHNRGSKVKEIYRKNSHWHSYSDNDDDDEEEEDDDDLIDNSESRLLDNQDDEELDMSETASEFELEGGEEEEETDDWDEEKWGKNSKKGFR